MRKLLLAVVLMVGCGGEGDPIGPTGSGGTTVPPASAIIGGWGAMASSSCILLLGFKEDGSYTRGTACIESSGRNDLDEEKGTFIEDQVGGNVHFVASQATCAGVTKTYHYGYAVSRGVSLTITASDAVVVMTPLGTWSGGDAPPSMGGVLTLGCISNGTFTPGPLMPVP